MYDLRKKEESNKKVDWAKYFNFIWKNKYRILLFIIIITLIFFPSFSGETIGTWIKNFLSNIIEHMS